VNRCFISAVLLALAAAEAPAADPDWDAALPGWKYEFPRDHQAHPGFKTEWWYFTGNLTGEDGRELGFQLTFFRQGVRRGEDASTRFAVDDIKLAHFAVTDISNGRFRFAQRVSRGAFGEAGFADGDRIAWIDDWVLRLNGPGQFRLEARDTDFAVSLDLAATQDPVFHGEDGVSQKSEGVGCASHYYSYARLAATGAVTIDGQEIAVKGWSWFDQEWATNQLTEKQTGWDWLSLQFEDNTELMLFQIRLKEGGRDSFSHGTWIDAEGNATRVKNDDFELVPGRIWTSNETGGDYPVEWKLRIPKLNLDLDVSAAMDGQELVLRPISYWEGSVQANGTREGKAVQGRGYLEMTGYAGGLVGLQAPETR
jgi:predicted secreted hydrolase